MRCVAAVALSFVVSSASAAISVSVDRVSQHWPWDGMVEIGYAVGGVSDGADYAISFACAEGAATNAVTTFTTAPVVANGAHTVVWNAAADGVDLSGEVSIIARLSYVAAPYDGDYMLIDVSGGTSSRYPVSYTNGVPDSSVFNTAEFKTDKIALKKIPAGTFLMGSPVDEEGRNTNLYNKRIPDETQHYVRISKPFFYSIFPVTQRQFSNVSSMENPSFSSGQANADIRAVERVIRNEHVFGPDGFFSNLCARAVFAGASFTGFTVPTESQWEYACRAGTTTAFYWGTNPEDCGTYCMVAQTWTPIVGQKAANPWGIYDLGTFYEWCRDTAGEYPAGTAENPAVDPFHTGGQYAAVRGCTYTNEGRNEYRRSAARWMLGANTRNPALGFRILVDVHDNAEYETSAALEGVTFDKSPNKRAVSVAQVELSSDEVVYTMSEVKPQLTISYEGAVLAEGIDYALSFSDAVNAGTCVITITGRGDNWVGSRTVSYDIVYPLVASAQAAARVDFRSGVLEGMIPDGIFPFAYNDAVEWAVGGDGDASTAARFSWAPVGSADETPAEEAFTTFFEGGGEGVAKWRPGGSGLAVVRFQRIVDGVADGEATLTRTFRYGTSGFSIILK